LGSDDLAPGQRRRERAVPVTSHSGLRTFRDAVAIITGGASGIGKAIAEALAKRGCSVVVADLQIGLAEELANTLASRGAKAKAAQVDVADFWSVKRVVDETRSSWGRLDFMFNNAAIAVAGELRDHTIEAWDRVIDVNLKGVVNGVQAAYPLMLEQGFGHIVNTASMQGLTTSPLSASYSTTKHAVVGLSKALRAEAWASGIRVSVLCPGVIRTPLLEGGAHGILLQPNDLPRLAEAQRRRLSLQQFERLRPMDPSRFADKVLEQLARDRAIIIFPSWWRILWWIERISPSLGILLARKFFEATRKQLSESIEQSKDSLEEPGVAAQQGDEADRP
jgi:NAD(P)-dependent dehydrogenase (short-subunit alcohol dehydrogenase family)